MKNLLMVLLLAAVAQGAVIGAKVKTKDSTSYANFNAYITATGTDTVSPYFAKSNLVVSTKDTCPANIDLAAFLNGAKLLGATGSAVDTLWIGKMSADPMRQIFDTSVTIRFLSGAVPHVRSAWFGTTAVAKACYDAMARSSGKTFVKDSVVFDIFADLITIDSIGQVRIKSTVNSSSVSTGSISTLGGVGIAKRLFVGGYVASDSIKSKTTNGPVVFYDSARVTKNFSVDGKILTDTATVDSIVSTKYLSVGDDITVGDEVKTNRISKNSGTSITVSDSIYSPKGIKTDTWLVANSINAMTSLYANRIYPSTGDTFAVDGVTKLNQKAADSTTATACIIPYKYSGNANSVVKYETSGDTFFLAGAASRNAGDNYFFISPSPFGWGDLYYTQSIKNNKHSFGGKVAFTDTTSSTSTTTGSIVTSGGVGVAKALYADSIVSTKNVVITTANNKFIGDSLVAKGVRTTASISTPKTMMTPEGGFAVLMINRTGGNSVKGEVVCNSSSYDTAVSKIVVDVPNPIGVFYESGVADGSAAWVVVGGKADVYFVGNTTRGHLARGFITGDAGYVTGQALSEAVPSSPFATDKHFYEIGHVAQSRTGAGLARCVLHFN